jgi:Cu-Zn family superoxide dismutase
MSKASLVILAAVIGLAGCGDRNAANPTGNEVTPGNVATNATFNAANAANSASAVPAGASATLQTAQGAPAGTARVVPMDGALAISIQVEGLPAGEHGVHVHMTGRCDPPSFESAGSHWNPTGAQHGLENPQGQHAGDMPNLTVDQNGRGSLDYVLKGGDLAGLLDTDGSAIIVHATVDDQKTDPSGNSGGRIACGVFTAA